MSGDLAVLCAFLKVYLLMTHAPLSLKTLNIRKQDKINEHISVPYLIQITVSLCSLNKTMIIL